MMGCLLKGYDLVLDDVKFGHYTRKERRASETRTPGPTHDSGVWAAGMTL